jgi:hypothetical protein
MNCPDCSVSEIGDKTGATVGAVGSVKRHGRWWVWHVHSLETHYNAGLGYTASGQSRSRDGADDTMHTILNIAAVAWEAGSHYEAMGTSGAMATTKKSAAKTAKAPAKRTSRTRSTDNGAPAEVPEGMVWTEQHGLVPIHSMRAREALAES